MTNEDDARIGGPADRERMLRELEQRAVRSAAERASEDAQEPLDLVRALKPDGDEEDAGPAEDLTFRGYVDKHDRVPAFEGEDGQPYTVDIDVERTGGPEDPWVAFLVFVRWARTGAGIMGHVESGDVATGATEEDARRGAERLTLYELKAELDAAIRRRQEAMSDTEA